MIKFLQKYIINGMIFILDFDIVNFPFFGGGVPIVYIYLNLYALLEHLGMLMTSIIVKKS